jgi:hypothetical protein
MAGRYPLHFLHFLHFLQVVLVWWVLALLTFNVKFAVFLRGSEILTQLSGVYAIINLSFPTE